MTLEGKKTHAFHSFCQQSWLRVPAALLPPQQQGCRKILTRSDHEVKGKGKVRGSQKKGVSRRDFQWCAYFIFFLLFDFFNQKALVLWPESCTVLFHPLSPYIRVPESSRQRWTAAWKESCGTWQGHRACGRCVGCTQVWIPWETGTLLVR